MVLRYCVCLLYTSVPSAVDGMPDGYVPGETTSAGTTVVSPNETTAASHTTAAPEHSTAATTAPAAASPAPAPTSAAATTAAENGGPGATGDVVIPVKPE